MKNFRKIVRKYYFSVEGETEKWYLEWLARAINDAPTAEAAVKFDVKVCKDPVSRVKQLAPSPKEIFHVFDIESQEQVHVEQTLKTLDRLKKASSLKSTEYVIGYSNYSFELWIVLHKVDGRAPLSHRRQYLKAINKAFGTQFEDLHEYKHEDKFKKVLAQLSLEDALSAVVRAKDIMKMVEQDFKPIVRSGYRYFRENPSLSLHTVVGKILAECGLIKSLKNTKRQKQR